MPNIRIYDNEGETVDRYTVIIDEHCYGMSHNPMQPNGFDQYFGILGQDVDEGSHLGIKLDHIPMEIAEAVNVRANFEDSLA